MPLALRLTTTTPERPILPLEGLLVERVTDPGVMACAQQRELSVMERRLDEGHRAYVARRGGAIVAWGWVATRTAELGELSFRFDIPPIERYLWNFVTHPSARGQGIYPRLLDAIVRAEAPEARRHWIAWAPENHASGAGIAKAGFRPVADLSFDDGLRPAVREWVPGGGGAASRLLGLPHTDAPMSRCWRCVREAAGRARRCAAGPCQCDYQRPTMPCAA